MLLRLAVITMLSCCMLLPGCGPAKLNESRTIELDSGDAKAIDLDGQHKAQTVTVEFSSPNAEVSVYLFKADDAKGDDGLLGADPSKALAMKKGKSDTLSAEVPADTPTRVILRNATEKTSVNVKISNQK